MPGLLTDALGPNEVCHASTRRGECGENLSGNELSSALQSWCLSLCHAPRTRRRTRSASCVMPRKRGDPHEASPCGGGRCFFAVSASGDLFPCSQFVGVQDFCGGNLFTGTIEGALSSQPFKKVTSRRVEDIDPCKRCAIRHFCGSPCPAEAHEMNGGMNQPGAFCGLYEEQVRYAIALHCRWSP